MHTGSRHRAFRDAVQARDGRCFVTGVVAPLSHRNRYVGFEAAHIFPLAYQGHWNDQKHSRWITVMPSAGGPINSVQNGLLLRSDVYQLFDSYFFSINPDVCKIQTAYLEATVANNYSRITTRSCVLKPTH